MLTTPGNFTQSLQDLDKYQKSMFGGCVGRLQKCIAKHIVVNEKVRAVGANAKRYNFCCNKRFKHSVRWAHISASGAFRSER